MLACSWPHHWSRLNGVIRSNGWPGGLRPTGPTSPPIALADPAVLDLPGAAEKTQEQLRQGADLGTPRVAERGSDDKAAS
jgi:hypothetical protein